MSFAVPLPEKVPAWAVKNKEIFLSAAARKRGHDVAPAATPKRSAVHMALADLQAIAGEEEASRGAMSMAVLAEDVQNGILPPTDPPAASYFENTANHPDVLTTIISTARATVGFTPYINGAGLTEAEIQDFVTKFNAFLAELDLYYAYIDLRGSQASTLANNTIDCSLMLSSVTSVLAAALGVATSGSVYDDLVATASALITTAVNYVSQNGKSTSANFEMVGLPKSNVEGEDPYTDPICAITFTTTVLSQQESGKNVVQDSSITISANSYQLKSSAIIEYADYLAGSSITGNSVERDYINSPLTDQKK